MHVRHDNWFKIKGEDEFFALRKTCPLFSCETRERTMMTDQEAKERKLLHDKHMKHARIWKYRPMDWHTWKVWFWPWHEDDPDIILKAAKKQNAVKLFGRKKEEK
jgi:hypothetical protein